MGKVSRRKPGNRARRVRQRAQTIVQTPAGTPGLRVRTDLPQEEKISNALSVLVNAEVPKGSPLVTYRVALSFIALAWNISLLPVGERSKALQDVMASIPVKDDETRWGAMASIERSIARKQELFPHDQRALVSWDVVFQEGTLRITAAALSFSA
jgi:hypothetical protein